MPANRKNAASTVNIYFAAIRFNLFSLAVTSLHPGSSLDSFETVTSGRQLGQAGTEKPEFTRK